MKETFTYFKVSTVVANKLGPDAGCVHAVIRNKSQNGYQCKLSEGEIGDLVHISYKRVREAIKDLLKYEYIEKKSDNNEYGTKTYIDKPENTDIELLEENIIRLKCNKARTADEVGMQYKRINHPRTNHTSTQDESSQGIGQSVLGDRTNHPNTQDESSHNKELKRTIKNYKELKSVFSSFSDNTQKKDIKEAIEYLTGVKCDERWNEFIDFVYVEETEHKHYWNDFVEMNFWGEFDPKYAHPSYFMRLWTKTDFPTYGYQPEFCSQLPLRVEPEYTDEEYHQFFIEANKERRAKKLGIRIE